VRTIARGGAEITRAMASRLNMSPAEAETLKCRTGLSVGEGPESAEVVDEAIRPLITEIRSSLSYYSTSHDEDRVRRLSLVGGAAQLPGLTHRLSETLGIPVELANPLQRVSDARQGGRHDVLARFRSSAAVSIGLTLGAA
jgi:type IV pilus assembly protein PilM